MKKKFLGITAETILRQLKTTEEIASNKWRRI